MEVETWQEQERLMRSLMKKAKQHKQEGQSLKTQGVKKKKKKRESTKPWNHDLTVKLAPWNFNVYSGD